MVLGFPPDYTIAAVNCEYERKALCGNSFSCQVVALLEAAGAPGERRGDCQQPGIVVLYCKYIILSPGAETIFIYFLCQVGDVD